MKRISVPAHRNPDLDRRYSRPAGLNDAEAHKHKIDHLDRIARRACEEHGIDPDAPDAIEQLGVAELPRAIPALADSGKPSPWTADQEAELIADMESERQREGQRPRTLSQTARRLAAWPKYSRLDWHTLLNRYRLARNRLAKIEAAA